MNNKVKRKHKKKKILYRNIKPACAHL